MHQFGTSTVQQLVLHECIHQAKIRKPSVPLSPVMTAYNTPPYKGAIFLSQISITLPRAYIVLKKIRLRFLETCHPLNTVSYHLVSFSISSLLSNIEVRETMHNICGRLLATDDKELSFGRKSFHNIVLDF